MRVSFLAVGALVALMAASLISLVVLAGGWREIAAGPLVAEVHLHEFAVPSDFRVDRNTLTEGLLRQIEARASSDVGLRMALDDLGRQQLTALIIPRLINPSVVARLIEDVSALSAILAIGEYRSAAEITVRNNTDAPLDDVVLMLPALIRVEDETQAPVDITTTTQGLTGIRIEQLAPRETRNWRVWLSATARDLQAMESTFRVGAAGGRDGQVYTFGRHGWLGRDLEILPWSRWTVGFVVVFAGIGAAMTLVLMAVLARRNRRVA